MILVYGPDTGLVFERAKRLAESFVTDPSDPFALVKIDGDTLASDAGRLVDEAGTVGLFGGQRSIWVRAGSRNYAPAVGRGIEGRDRRRPHRRRGGRPRKERTVANTLREIYTGARPALLRR